MDQNIGLLDHAEGLFGLDRFHLRNANMHHCEPTWAWDPPVFVDFDLWFVFAGAGHVKVNGTRHSVRAGSVFLFQPGDRVSGRQDPRNRLVVFACHFEPTEPLQLADGGRLTREVLMFHVNDPERYRGLAERAARAGHASRIPSAMGKLILAEMVLLVLSDASGWSDPSVDEPLSRLAVAIGERPGAAWELNEMARQCSLSVPQFTRRFRSVFGVSPRQFVIRQRIRRAVHLLRESHLPIQRIAETLGYNDHYFFHRQFKAVTGTTPLKTRGGARTRIDD